MAGIFIYSPVHTEVQQKKPKVALVLSGGGAKGLAEIPLLEAIEEEGIKVDMVLGTSMGALLGAMYSSGYSPKEIREIMSSLDFVSILSDWTVPMKRVPAEAFSTKKDNLFSLSFSLTDPKFGSAPSLLGDQKILTLLDSYFSKVGGIDDFDRLPVPFRAMTTDISTGKEVLYKNGSIVKAIRGSMSLPGVWVPARMDDGTYVLDGGLENNLPLQEAVDMGADIIIAIDSASSLYTDPATLDDLLSVGAQIFNLIISTNAIKQHKIADLLLIPDLDEFSTVDFTCPRDIIDAGQKCVEQNRGAIHQIALELQKAGVQLEVQDYDRESLYSKMPERVIESITVSDVSFKEPVPLPSQSDFKDFIGRELNDYNQKKLVKLLNELRIRYHLASLSFDVRNGSDSGHCVIDIQANHYNQNLSRIFFGGNPGLYVSNSDAFTFAPVPEFTFGVYLNEPLDMILHCNYGNTSSFDFSLMPCLFKPGQTTVHFDAGAEFKAGSLEPHSNIIFEDHSLDDDLGLGAHAGLQLRYVDIASIAAGGAFTLDYLCYNDEYYRTMYLYFNSLVQTMNDEITGLNGFKMDLLLKAGQNMKGDIYLSGQFKYKQNIELVDGLTGVSLEFSETNVRFPHELNAGYGDFGGFDGMCGYPCFTLRRDFAVAGLSFKQHLFTVFGLPFVLIAQGKAGICDDYNPYTDYGTKPSDSVFHGVSELNDIIYGGGLYLAVNTPIGNVVLGGSLNSRGKYCIQLGLK